MTLRERRKGDHGEWNSKKQAGREVFSLILERAVLHSEMLRLYRFLT
jgi:hypothetical protein